jgi:hypothetical protein
MFHNQRQDTETAQTITLSRSDIRAARRLLRALLSTDLDVADEQLNGVAAPVREQDRAELIARARADFQNRRLRVTMFGRSMFGEAAWDMLLALYILEMSDERQTVGKLLQLAGVPATTAKRWLEYLEAHEFVRREAHPTDRRTAFVSLTPKARGKLDLYYSRTVPTNV